MPWSRNMTREHVPADGNCLFASVIRLMDDVVTPNSLREVVADEIRQPEHKDTLDVWWALAPRGRGEPSMSDELQHIPPRTDEVMDDDWVAQLQANMLNPMLYWGDEFALKVLERLYTARFVVLAKVGRRTTVSTGFDHGPDWVPTCAGLLYLSHNHYEPLFHASNAEVELPLPYSRIPSIVKRMMSHGADDLQWYQQLLPAAAT